MRIDGAASSYFSNVASTNSASTKQASSGALTDTLGSDVAAKNKKVYDFSNMTPQDMLKTMNDLIKSGKMSVDESSSLVAMIPSPLSKVDYDGKMPDTFYQPTDFIAKMKQGISFDQSVGNDNGVRYGNMALSALMRLQGQAFGVDQTA